MADAKLSALTALTPLADGDLFYVVRSTTSYKTTLEDLRAAVGGIEGAVTNYAALPVTVGTPAVGARYIVQEDQGSYFTFNKKPAGLYERTANNGVSADWTRLGDFTLVPFRDDQAFYDNADGTKTLKFQLSGITTATERVATWPDKDGTVAMTNDKLSAAAATTSAELAGVISDETGTGALVFANTPTLVTPVLGTPTSGTLTNCDGLTEAGLTLADNTTADASTSAHGLVVKATAPAAGLINVVAIGNGETAYTNKALLDSTNPAALGTVGPGTATVAARRDHVHAMPSAADVGALPTAGGTMTGNITQAENSAIVLDPALSADGKYCGIVQAGTAGTTLTFGDLVYLAAADSRWELTDADASATAGPVKIGICVLAAAADGDPTTILLWGKVRADTAFPTLTIGAPVYVGLTAGDVAVSETWGTDDVIRVIGHGEDANTLWFNPSNDFITYV